MVSLLIVRRTPDVLVPLDLKTTATEPYRG
jgi:hypothetical protein